MALSFSDRTLINVALPSLKQEFGLTDGQLGFLAGLAFSLVNVIFALPIAKWADRTSRSMVLTVSLGIWSLATAATAACAGLGQIVAARMALGLAEAGGSSPAQSIIADLYRPAERSMALAIYNSGAGLGGFTGLALGAVVIQAHGWRMAYVVFGTVGLALAIGLGLALREPPRGLSEDVTRSDETAARVSICDVLNLALTRPSYFHVIGGNALNGFATFGAGAWMPSFLIRSHGLSIAQAGAILAPILLVSGTISQVAGGWISDLLGRHDVRFTLIAPALIMLVGVPLEISALLVRNTALCLALFFLGNMSVGPFAGAVMSTVQGIAGLRQRTMAAALMLTVVGLVGAGLGPWVNGLISDVLARAYGGDSLRLAMIVILFLRFWAAAHIYLASRHLAADFARRPD
jgi:MFS family permease